MWQPRADRLRVLDRALEDARDGSPRLVSIVGAAGMGKTSHLRQLVNRATDFRVLEAAGDSSEFHAPFGVLRQLGVEHLQAEDGAPFGAVAAGRSMQRLLDNEDTDTILIAIDDAQWVDAESLESLRWLFERMRADRVVVAVASRPMSAFQRAGWQRLLVASWAVRHIRLSGELSDAREIVRNRPKTPQKSTPSW
jgi:predicted ATPase